MRTPTMDGQEFVQKYKEHTYRAFGIQWSVRAFAQVVWNACVLGPGLGKTIGENETLERNMMEILDHVDFLNAQAAGAFRFHPFQALVTLVDDLSNIGSKRSTITLRSDVEGPVTQVIIFGKEELEERIDILGGDRGCVDGGRVGGVREADFGGLVEEDNVGVVRPAVWIHFGVRERRRRRGIITD
jgi:hypothetical protein